MGHKRLPDRVLKGAILNSLKSSDQTILLELTLSQISDHIANVPYFCESPEVDVETGEPLFSGHFTYNNKDGVRKELTYLRQAGYISKLGNRKPHTYTLTQTGIENASNPFVKYEHKRSKMIRDSYAIANGILENSDQFREAVRDYIEKNDVKEINVVQGKAPIIKPVNQTIRIQMDDGVDKEIELDSKNEIKEVQELKAQISQLESNHTAAIQEYENYVRELEYTLSTSDIEAVKKFERTLSREEKKQMRYALAVEYWNNGYYLDEYFFKQWGADYIIAVLKKLMELGQLIAPEYVDIFSRNSDLYKRRKSRIKRIVTGKEIAGCEIVIIGTTESGVVIDSQYLEAEKTLKW
jgi:hypothetical protein